jgi:hypothetical protein
MRAEYNRIVTSIGHRRVKLLITESSYQFHLSLSYSAARLIAKSHSSGDSGMNRFLAELKTQRWDDHRLYHHCRINQSLHLISALAFLVAYAMLLIEPAYAALIAWCISMTTRQAGHFFFEPRGYDHINEMSDEHKEAIKVGYNIQRKIVLMSLWGAVPMVLWIEPGVFGLITPAASLNEFVKDVGMAWLALGIAGLLFRTVQLALTQGGLKAIAWASKILTDPFHDVWLYHKAPLALLRGERFDPMFHVIHRSH